MKFKNIKYKTIISTIIILILIIGSYLIGKYGTTDFLANFNKPSFEDRVEKDNKCGEVYKNFMLNKSPVNNRKYFYSYNLDTCILTAYKAGENSDEFIIYDLLLKSRIYRGNDEKYYEKKLEEIR